MELHIQLRIQWEGKKEEEGMDLPCLVGRRMGREPGQRERPWEEHCLEQEDYLGVIQVEFVLLVTLVGEVEP